MNFLHHLRTMNKRLRLMLLATVLLLAPGIGQFVTIHDLNTIGHASQLALLFAVAGLFLIPTSLILTGVITFTTRREWRQHERLMILGALNALIAANLIWFFFGPCSWAQIFGLALQTCR
jgi:hypothetical protein